MVPQVHVELTEEGQRRLQEVAALVFRRVGVAWRGVPYTRTHTHAAIHTHTRTSPSMLLLCLPAAVAADAVAAVAAAASSIMLSSTFGPIMGRPNRRPNRLSPPRVRSYIDLMRSPGGVCDRIAAEVGPVLCP